VGSADATIEALFALTPDIRYVAVYRGGELSSQERQDLADASASESDRYEELLVNPTLVTLARQRGDIDCGGLEYLVIRYGHFFQFVVPIEGGHASIAFEPHANPVEHAASLREIIDKSLA
jgi:hypothetical protein